MGTDTGKISAALLAVAVVLASCGEREIDGLTRKKIDDIVSAQMAAKHLPGVVVGVWMPGQGQYIRAYGTADLPSSARMTDVIQVRIADITKTFTSLVIMKMADNGTLSLDDRIESYVPGVTNGELITLRQLLNMTSGIFNYMEDAQFIAAYKSDPLMVVTPEQEVAVAASHPPYFDPGQGFHYSDTSYTLLGMVIQKITGQDPGTVIRDYVIEGLAMVHTFYPVTPEMPAGSASGYTFDGSIGEYRDYTRSDPSVPNAGGAVISNLYDLRLYIQLLVDGVLTSTAMHREMLAGIPIPGLEDLGGSYGLGVAMYGGFVGHSGATFGYNSAAYHHKDRNSTIIVFANGSDISSTGATDIFVQIACVFYPYDHPAICPQQPQ
jgi:D-alanyl-D-alanine carboxypeptidase